MKVLLVEDEFYTRKGLLALLHELQKDIEVVGESGTVEEAVALTRSLHPDLVLLDIHLPDGDAFNYLEQTTEFDFQIIFITAHDNFAIKAIKQGAVDYILKPVVPEDLEEAIDKVVASYQAGHPPAVDTVHREKLFLSFNDCIQVIHFQELMFCESDNGYTTFFLSNGQSFLSSKPLKDFESEFPTKKFVRTHQSFIVNLDYVNRYQKDGYCILHNDQKIPVSVRRKKQFMTQLMQ